MNKNKSIKRVLIATFFLASYSGVYATYFLCNLVPLVSAEISHAHDHPDHENDGHHQTGSHSHKNQKHAHNNPCGDHQGSNSHKHDHDNHSHDHGKTMDECCNDLTFPFINSLPKLSPKQFHFEFAVTAVPIIHSHLVLDKPSPELYPKLAWYIHPPPKVPDIRVFIQSFII